jgi:two-component system phosphate regulon sensor histidine kinase PhoR
VAAYYLLFATAVVAWLTAGIVQVTHGVLASRTTSGCLTRLGQAERDVTAAISNGGENAVQTLLSGLAHEDSTQYWAILGPTGLYVAHSDRSLVGKPGDIDITPSEQWGDVVRVERASDADGSKVWEYRTRIEKAGALVGVLCMGVTEPGVWPIIRSAGDFAPTAVLGPLLLSLAGAVVLHGLVRPVAGIEDQLSRLSAAEDTRQVALRSLPGASAAHAGWNRLVAERESTSAHAGLETRAMTALDAFRTRQADEILNTLPDGIALTDAEGRITSANHALSVLLGLGAAAPASLLGKSMEACLQLAAQGSDRPLARPEMKSRLVVEELERPSADGNGILRVARHPLRGQSHQACGGHVWCLRDVTQQKLAEQTRNQFVNSATHELRTPLANIKAYAETLALSDMLDVERQKEFCNTINSEATRLARFIDDLLNISSMELGSMALARQESDIERLLLEVVEKVRAAAEQKQIRLHTSFPAKLPKLRVDKDKLAATLVNLLGNAIKYTPAGGAVAFRAVHKDGSLQIEVEDTGIGIAADELPKIYDKFFRSADPRVREETGTGLGLSLAQEVIRLHGGKLHVQSELNKGTRFTVTLPAGGN